MNVAMAGSHDLPLSKAANGILKVLVGLPPNTKLLLRRGKHTPPGPFERLVAQLCDSLAIEYEWRRPQEGGRSATYLRDVSMADAADGVIAFFHPERIMDGGTGHLVEKAMDAGRPVWAMTVGDEGLERVGEIDAPPGDPAEVLGQLTLAR